jgi:hypothetical protein
MKKIKGYNPIKNLGSFAHKPGATRPAGLAKIVKPRITKDKPKKGY